VNQDLAHQLGGDGEEVSAVLPWDSGCIDELKVGLVDQRAGLQNVAGFFSQHVEVRQAVQLTVDKRDEFIKGRPFTAAPGMKQLSDFLRGLSCHSPSFPGEKPILS
jgi:hypothetical protein